VRRFPVILDHLFAGWVNVTTVKVLAPVLTEENHLARLTEARHRRRRDVEIIVARIAPRPETPGTIRKLPSPSPLPPSTPMAAPSSAPPPVAGNSDGGAEPSPGDGADEPAPAGPAAFRPPVRPIAPARFRLDVTVGQEAHDALRFLQDMFAREIPGGDVSKVVEHSLIATAREVRKRKMAATDRPRKAREIKADSRDVAASVRRFVWKRDGARCTFVGRHGRCTQTRSLDLHHIHPYALGGPGTADNLTLRCRAHNQYESEQVYGARAAAARYRRPEKPAVSGQIAPSQDGGARPAEQPRSIAPAAGSTPRLFP
jgi:5-methylcytosine-specific restriction endonuclease McrA